MKAYKGGKTNDSKEQPHSKGLQAVKQPGIPQIVLVPNQSEHKYSLMLLELIRPHLSPFPTIEEVDWLLTLGRTAWNIANLKKELPEGYTAMNQDLKEQFKGNKKELKQLNSMVNDKERKFGEDTLYIIDYEIQESNSTEINVITRAGTLEAFLMTSMMAENEGEYYNDEPAYINRMAVMVKVREPFKAWLKELEDNITVDEDLLEPNIYLLEIKDSPKATESWLKKNFDLIFKKELEEWSADERTWPKQRTYQKFQEWFEISFHSSIYDLEDYPVDKDLV